MLPTDLLSLTSWPILALAFSVCGALIIGFNQWARLDGNQLVIWRSAGVLPLATVAMLVLPIPQNFGFYAIAALMGVMFAYADILLFNASRDHGARLTALYIPLKMVMAFSFWAVMDPLSLLPLLLEPWRLPLVLVGFALCGGALMYIRQCDASVKAVIAILPVAILFTLGDVVAKVVLPPPVSTSLQATIGGAVAYLATTTAVGTVCGLVLHRKGVAPWPVILKSTLFGVLMLGSIGLLLVTLAIAPNPGYVAAVTMLSALWLALWATFVRGERTNLWAGLGLLLGALCVAFGGH